MSNLEKILKWIFEWYDQGNSLDIYLDFSKAFDKVPQKRLIKKLEGYRISGNVSRWIAEWLGDRKQRVQLNGYRSGWTEFKGELPMNQ